uniref:M-phase inducer phosphatase n=1 Tax=Microcebus murinus TaxID=30608 RepID=A0A8C5W060_MICMU
MSTELISSTREEESSGSGPSYRSNKRKMLNLLLERDTSFTVCPDLPRTAVDKLLGDSANLSILSGEMKYLGSPIPTFPKVDQSSDLDDQAEEISDELMGFSLEDQEALVNRSRLYRSPSMPENLNRPRLKQVAKFKDNPIPDKVKKKYYSGHRELRKVRTVCVLPTVSGRHQDLKYVSPETVAALLLGKFQDLIEKFYIIDCRYPYEYLGGHIQGALNLYSQEELYNFFLKKPIVPVDTQKRIIIVFHCEFSSERGPRMCRSLREEDRALNKYPALHFFPEYMVKGEPRLVLCEPQSYCPMHHQDHKAELLRCRSQNKVWEGERQLREQIALLVKDESQ